MDYKEKYEKALEWMKSVYSTMQGSDKEDAEHYFPELRESEDERIRKALIDGVRQIRCKNGITQEQMIAYLEKQKEQKPRDYRKLYEEVVNSEWFKQNYEGKSLGEEQKQEWSEEDEEMRKNILWVLESFVSKVECEQNPALTTTYPTYFKETAWLKSLRPVSKDSLQSWKPSEAHLSALLAIFNDPDNIGSQTCQLALTDLYEQLNKL